MNNVNFKHLADVALSRSRDVVEHYLPDGKSKGNEYTALSPTRSNSGVGSLRVNIEAGIWSDFASGDNGADLTSLVAYVNSCSLIDAYHELSNYLDISGTSQGWHGES